jgi:rhodanese-related sulfurtransferase
MFRRTIAPETTPAAAHGRHADQVLLDVREDDEWAAAGLPVVRDDGRRGRVV